MSGKKVLIIDPSLYEREKIKHIMKNSGGEYEFLESVSYDEFSNIYREQTDISVIILDISLPDPESGLLFLENLRKNSCFAETPVLVITKTDSSDIKTAALKLSVNDYIIKPYQAKRLENSVKSLIKPEIDTGYDTSSMKNIVFSFSEYVERELKFAARMKTPLSIMLFTPAYSKEESFKENITYPELKKQARSITESIIVKILRTTDTLFVNADDLLLILPGTSEKGASVLSERIKKRVSAELEVLNIKFEHFFYTAFAVFPENGKNFQSLVKTALKKISDKDMLEKITSISANTINYANRSYVKFKKSQ